MIDLYTWPTPNGRKISIMLEETGVNYTVFPVNIGKDHQFQPNFLRISPNNKIPAIVDKENNNYSLFESGAILMYLAEKSGMLINKSNSDEYFRTIEWVMWQMGGVGPMVGQVHHFVTYNNGSST